MAQAHYKILIMSLELFANISKEIDLLSVDKISKMIQELGYDLVFNQLESAEHMYGYVYKDDIYDVKQPPLFTLAINSHMVILSVFGDLNECRTIESQIVKIFNEFNFDLTFEEED
jgi:hypothetical protein